MYQVVIDARRAAENVWKVGICFCAIGTQWDSEIFLRQLVMMERCNICEKFALTHETFSAPSEIEWTNKVWIMQPWVKSENLEWKICIFRQSPGLSLIILPSINHKTKFRARECWCTTVYFVRRTEPQWGRRELLQVNKNDIKDDNVNVIDIIDNCSCIIFSVRRDCNNGAIAPFLSAAATAANQSK